MKRQSLLADGLKNDSGPLIQTKISLTRRTNIKILWEEETPLLEGVSSKAGNASSYAASIGLEISGSEDFVTDACALVLEFRDIFSTELSPEPADLPSVRCTY